VGLITAECYRYNSLLPDHLFVELPSTIQFLSLPRVRSLSSYDLSFIAESCPNLLCLNINSCKDVLYSLDGLADIAEKCKNLESLSASRIDEVESVPLFWEVVSTMKKLKHLTISKDVCISRREDFKAAPSGLKLMPGFDDQSLLHLKRSLAQIKLISLEISFLHDYQCSVDFDLLLPGLKFLKHLLIKDDVHIDLELALQHMPHLESLSIKSECTIYDVPKAIFLPTDPISYGSLKRFQLAANRYNKFKVTSDMMHCLKDVRQLFLTSVSFDPVELLNDVPAHFPRVCECYIQDDNFEGTLELEKSGVCGLVTGRERTYHNLLACENF